MAFSRINLLIFIILICSPAASFGKEESSIRVVPQIDWNEKGILSPDGKLAATIILNTLRTVDIEHLQLISLNVLDDCIENCSFSPDGLYLTACAHDGGILIDLKSYSVQELKLLAGSAVAFSADSKLILIGTCNFGDIKRENSHLRIIDLNGTEKQKYPLDMVIPCLITCEGEDVIITGIGGYPYAVSGETYQVIQRINVFTDESTTQINRRESYTEIKTYQRFPINIPASFAIMGGTPIKNTRTIRENPAESLFSDLPKPKGNQRQKCEDIFWDEVSGIAVLFGTGAPEGYLFKAWNVYEGYFISTLGIRGEVIEPVGFVRQGVFLANSKYDRSEVDPDLLKKLTLETDCSPSHSNTVKLPTEFDLVNGGRHPIDDLYETKEPYPHNQHLNEDYQMIHKTKHLSIANGELGLRLDKETMRFHLITIPEEEIILTFIVFDNNQWMVHNTDGYWNGSNDILKNVAFFRGSGRLTESEIKELKNPDEIRKVLSRHISAKEIIQPIK